MTQQTHTAHVHHPTGHQRGPEGPAGRPPERAPAQIDPAKLEQAITDLAAASPAAVLALQQRAGNRAVRGLVQAKLTVGPAGDQYEQEADRVAGEVLASPAPPVQRQEEEEEVQTKLVLQRQEEEEEVQTKPVLQRQGEEEEVQTKPVEAGAGFEAGGELESRVAASRGGGSPLPGEVRHFMEPRFGADFGGVRVHTGSEADHLNRELKAVAFTHGQDIYMGEGRYDPGTTAGKRLLAHELTHVVQQTPAVKVGQAPSTKGG